MRCPIAPLSTRRSRQARGPERAAASAGSATMRRAAATSPALSCPRQASVSGSRRSPARRSAIWHPSLAYRPGATPRTRSTIAKSSTPGARSRGVSPRAIAARAACPGGSEDRASLYGGAGRASHGADWAGFRGRAARRSVLVTLLGILAVQTACFGPFRRHERREERRDDRYDRREDRYDRREDRRDDREERRDDRRDRRPGSRWVPSPFRRGCRCSSSCGCRPPSARRRAAATRTQSSTSRSTPARPGEASSSSCPTGYSADAAQAGIVASSTAVPEPGAAAMLLVGGSVLPLVARTRRPGNAATSTSLAPRLVGLGGCDQPAPLEIRSATVV